VPSFGELDFGDGDLVEVVKPADLRCTSPIMNT
jgi:hypothetical protein